MSGSVRMAETAGMSRGLYEFRRIDPEQRLLANRSAAEAAVHRMEELHRDVTKTEKPAEGRVADRQRQGQDGGRDEDQQPEAASDELDEKGEEVPERPEGHLLNIVI